MEKTNEELIAEIEKLRQENAQLKAGSDSIYFHSLIESIPGIVYQFSIREGGIFYSSQVVDILGYSPSQLISNPMLWNESIHPDDTLQVNQIIQRVREVKSFCIEYRIKDNKGEWHWLEDRSLKFKSTEDDFIIVGHAIDITDRKILEERTSHLLLERETILDNIATGIFFLKDRKIVWANKKAAAMYEYSLEEIVGESTLKFYLNEKVYEEFGKAAYSTLSSGRQFSTEVKQKKKSGNEFWCSFVGQAINPNNPQEGSIWIAKDITTRKNLENEVLESEKKLKTIFDMLDVGVSITDKMGNIVDCNKASEKILGLTKEQCLSRNNTENEWKVIRPDLSIMPPEEFASVRAMKEKRAISNVEMGVQKPDGSISWIIVNASPIELSNYGVVVSFIDITEQKRIEQELRRERDFNFRIMETSFVGIVYLDKNGKIILANPRAVSIFGLTHNEVTSRDYNVPDWHIADLEGNDFPVERLPFVQVKNTLKPVADIQHSIQAPNGKQVLLSINAAPMIGSNGEFEGVIASIEDITERKQVEKEVMRQNKELAELNASKDKFFSIIAHDLRGPFSGFLGLTEMMEVDEMSLEEMKQVSNLIHASAEKIFKPLENLLAWASVQKGTIEFNPKPYFLSEILDESINVLSDTANKKEIEIVNQVSKKLEVIIDYAMINVIFRNLISNSIKFTNRGGKVIIGAEDKGKEILVYVKDNGIGMSLEILEKIFRIDQKVNREGTEKESSSGIGLLLCKEFIEKHQGRVWAESEVDIGSTLYFTIGKGDSGSTIVEI